MEQELCAFRPFLFCNLLIWSQNDLEQINCWMLHRLRLAQLKCKPAMFGNRAVRRNHRFQLVKTPHTTSSNLSKSCKAIGMATAIFWHCKFDKFNHGTRSYLKTSCTNSIFSATSDPKNKTTLSSLVPRQPLWTHFERLKLNVVIEWGIIAHLATFPSSTKHMSSRCQRVSSYRNGKKICIETHWQSMKCIRHDRSRCLEHMSVIHVSEFFYISKVFFCRILAEGSSSWNRTPEMNLVGNMSLWYNGWVLLAIMIHLRAS